MDHISMGLSEVSDVIRAAYLNRENGIQAITPYLVGSVGTGKTTTSVAAAESLGIDHRVVILAQYDAGELRGLIYHDNGETVWLRPNWLPSEGQGILVIDELPQAPLANQNIAAQLVNERRIGEHKLGDGWIIVCTGNAVKHRAGANQIPTHLKDRLTYCYIEADVDDTLDYMNSVGVNPAVIGYLKFRPSNLCVFDKDADACPSPRSWHKVSDILSWGLPEEIEFKLIIGQVGKAAAADFRAYLNVYRALPDPEAPLKTPETAEIPTEPSILFAVCANLAQRVNKSNVGNFFKYLTRLTQQEFAAFALKSLYPRWPEVKNEEAFKAWVREHGKHLV